MQQRSRSPCRKVVYALLLAAVGGWVFLNASFLRRHIPEAIRAGEGELRRLRGGAEEPVLLNVVGTAMDIDDEEEDYDDRTFANVGPLRMHGDVGTYLNGTAVWEPSVYPNNPPDMPTLLREGGGFNLLLSDATPLDRNVSDSCDKECGQYDIAALPDACVVIVFYNEPFSTLFRSVHSVLHRSPPELLREIVLVDDGSDLDWIREGGRNFISEYLQYVPKTRLVRNPVRKGIVGARMAGIRACQAPIFVILDSHVEVNRNWLEPLVHRIDENPTHILMPSVDGIDPKTLVPRTGGIGCTLGFLWKLIEHSFDPGERSPAERRSSKPTDFITSPTMAGGLFAANTDFFFEVGGYDEMFEYWGTENLELSFRLWMCGGVLECAPCSRVYHIFREGGVGYSSPDDAVWKNKMRTLVIWMDEFADLAWQTIGRPRVDFGDYEERLRWRKQRGCKSFKWFLDKVNPESMVREVPRDVPYLGEVKNEGSNQCLDNMGSDYPGGSVGLVGCHGGRTQRFVYFKPAKHISPVQNDETCVGHGAPNVTGWCHPHLQLWDFREAERQLVYERTGECLASEGGMLSLAPCDAQSSYQRWSWTKYAPPNPFTPPPLPKLRGAEFRGGN